MFMKKIILLSFLLIFTLSAYGENFYSGLSKLEKQMFKQTYEYDLPESRMERLETKLFGTCQSGNLSERYSVLQSAAKNYKAYTPSKQVYNQYQRPIFTGSTGSSWRNMLWGNFMNQFAGYPTGFTPAFNPAMDPAYMDYFEAERAMANPQEDEYYQTNRGYRTKRTDRSSRTGVTILD